MTIREWFEQGRSMEAEVQQLKAAKAKALDLACYNTTEDKMEKYSTYSQRLDKMITELEEHRITMLDVINKIDESTYRALLIARYINCKTWEEISEEMYYSDRWVRTALHSKALREAEKKIGEVIPLLNML